MTTHRKSLGILKPVNTDRIGMRSAPVKPCAVKGDENAYLPEGRRKTVSTVIGSDDLLKCKPLEKLSKHDADTQTDVDIDGSVTRIKDDNDKDDDAQLHCDMMTKEDVSPEYWKVLAERRREALAEALEENKRLHEENKQLREDNANLLELANQAEYFANMLKEVTEGDMVNGS